MCLVKAFQCHNSCSGNSKVCFPTSPASVGRDPILQLLISTAATAAAVTDRTGWILRVQDSGVTYTSPVTGVIYIYCWFRLYMSLSLISGTSSKFIFFSFFFLAIFIFVNFFTSCALKTLQCYTVFVIRLQTTILFFFFFFLSPA